MQSTAKTVQEYVDALPEDRQKAINELRKVIKKIYRKDLKKK